MAYVYSRTEGLAQEHLTPCYQQDLDKDFRNIEEMLTYLQECYQKPDEEATALQMFNALVIRPDELISDFQTDFIHLASLGCMSMQSRSQSIQDKLEG